jgi:hypothetical protein
LSYESIFWRRVDGVEPPRRFRARRISSAVPSPAVGLTLHIWRKNKDLHLGDLAAVRLSGALHYYSATLPWLSGQGSNLQFPVSKTGDFTSLSTRHWLRDQDSNLGISSFRARCLSCLAISDYLEGYPGADPGTSRLRGGRSTDELIALGPGCAVSVLALCYSHAPTPSHARLTSGRSLVLKSAGGPFGTRTQNLELKRHLLCRLS